MSKVREISPKFADKLKKEHGGSLGKAFLDATDKSVDRWLEKYGAIREIDNR